MAESNEVTKSSRSTRKQSTKQKDLATAPTVGDTDQQDGCRCSCKDAIMDIHKKLDKILQSLETIEKRVTYLEIKLDDTKTQVTIQRKEIDEIKLAVNMMERNQQNTTVLINKKDDAHHRVTSRLEDQIDDLQNRSRRNNIVIHGVPEGSEGNKSCEEFVSDLLTNHMKLDGGDTIEIERAHRSPGRVQPSNNGTASRARPRPIHCRLLRYTDRQHIIKSAYPDVSATTSSRAVTSTSATMLLQKSGKPGRISDYGTFHPSDGTSGFNSPSYPCQFHLSSLTNFIPVNSRHSVMGML